MLQKWMGHADTKWNLKYALSYKNLEEIMIERGLSVNHTTIYRWVMIYAPESEKRSRNYLKSNIKFDNDVSNIFGRPIKYASAIIKSTMPRKPNIIPTSPKNPKYKVKTNTIILNMPSQMTNVPRADKFLEQIIRRIPKYITKKEGSHTQKSDVGVCIPKREGSPGIRKLIPTRTL